MCLSVRVCEGEPLKPEAGQIQAGMAASVTCTGGGHGETKSVQVVAETVSQPDKTGPRG